VGNPPFLGPAAMKQILSPEYVDPLRRLYEEIPIAPTL